MKPVATPRVKKKMMDPWFNQHHRKPCAGKYTEDEDHLRDAINFPAGLKFFQPLWCGQAMWF